LANAALTKGDTKYAATDTGILAVKYRASVDKSNNKPKVVHMLTTDHANTLLPTSKKDRDGATIHKLQCVLDYNRHMGGVDVVDQQLESILAIRKTYKWYKKILFRLLLQLALSTHKLSARRKQTGLSQVFARLRDSDDWESSATVSDGLCGL